MVLRSITVEVQAWSVSVLGHGTLTAQHVEAGGQMSHQFRYDSDEQDTVAVKVRSDSTDRISRCLQIQRIAADAGFPCARPLTGADLLEPGLVISAETWLPGGEMHSGGEVSFADRSAKLLADLMKILQSQSPTGLGAPPPWMHWNPPTGGLWPPNPVVDALDQDQDLVPGDVHAIARAVSLRLAQGRLPLVVGHGDWESQNLRWQEGPHGRFTIGIASSPSRKRPLSVQHPAPLPAPPSQRWQPSKARKDSSAPTRRRVVGSLPRKSVRLSGPRACGLHSITPEVKVSSNPRR